MKLSFIRDTTMFRDSGIWWHRNETPMKALATRGHGVNQFTIKAPMSQGEMEYPDTVIFGRTYPQAFNPIAIMRDYHKLGKRVLYDMDDDYWMVTKDNPSVLVSNVYKDQYEGMVKEADALITPSKDLAKKFKVFKKPVFLCHNGINYNVYKERPRNSFSYEKIAEGEHIGYYKQVPQLVIGYMGASSHWKDLQIPMEALIELYKKYDFTFNLYGMINTSLEDEMDRYKEYYDENKKPEQNNYFEAALDFYSKLKNLGGHHIPFARPTRHPATLSRCDFDIGIAPLLDNEFNKGKSCVKFYEYASVGTVTISSDVEPYRSECNYRAKNTTKDWYNKLEKLIVDKDFREKILKQQQDWVRDNRSLEAIALEWELACQKPGGLKVLNQQR